MSFLRPLLTALFVAFALTAPVSAQEPPLPPDIQGKLNSIRWQQGPCEGKVGTLGTIKVPAGYKYTEREGTAALLEATMNIPGAGDLGTLCPNSWPADNAWFVIFTWDGVGYVKDDDKNNLDADALLASMREGQNRANEVLQAKGWPTVNLTGWKKAPFYDPQTNLLTWATIVNSGGGVDTINYNSRILGRGGVMSVNLVIDPDKLNGALPTYQTILTSYAFNPGQRYGEFRSGDKIAEYGLAALVAGGAAGLAAKSGLLAKFGKFIIFGVVAVFGGIASVFKKIFGRGDTA